MDKITRIGIACVVVVVLIGAFLYRRDAVSTKDKLDDNTGLIDELTQNYDAIREQVNVLCGDRPNCKPAAPPSEDITGDGSREPVIIKIPEIDSPDPNDPDPNDPDINDLDPNDPDPDDPEIQDPEIQEPNVTGIASIALNENCELIFTFSDGSTANLGNICGPQGPEGPAGAPGDTGPTVVNITVVEVDTNTCMLVTTYSDDSQIMSNEFNCPGGTSEGA